MENKKRLIDVDEAFEVVTSLADMANTKGEYKGYWAAGTAIKKMPTVDAVEVVHGHWEYGKWEKGHWVKGNKRCRCSVCHRDFAVDNLNIWHGCPHCLAKMDGGNEDG